MICGMDRIRVVQIVESMVGGVREHLRQIAANIDRERFELTLMCSAERDPGLRAELDGWRAGGVSVIEVPMARSISPWHDFRCYRRIRRHLAARRFDVIHTHGSKGGFLGRMAAGRNAQAFVVHTGHTFPMQWAAGLEDGFYAALERAAARRSDCIIALTADQKLMLVDRRIAPRETIVVLPNATDLPPLPGADERRVARERLGLPPDAPVVGMVGRVVEQKAPALFLSIARMVLAMNPPVRFVWVGGGPLRKPMQRLAREMGIDGGLHFAGERNDARELYAAFDIFLMTTLWEGMPYALLEAMAAGLPAITVNVPGIREVVEHGCTGYVWQADALSLADSVLGLLHDEPRRRAIGHAARQRVEQRHSVREFISRLQELYVAGCERKRFGCERSF